MAYEFQLNDRFVPKHGRDRIERTFVLLDLGVSMSLPGWATFVADRGRVVSGIDPGLEAAVTWYVDLVAVEDAGDSVIVRDLYLDVMVPTDGRHQRMLDLDEFADAIDAGTLPIEVATDALRRWQTFLDRHLHGDRDPQQTWTDFPPMAFLPLIELPVPSVRPSTPLKDVESGLMADSARITLARAATDHCLRRRPHDRRAVPQVQGCSDGGWELAIS